MGVAVAKLLSSLSLLDGPMSHVPSTKTNAICSICSCQQWRNNKGKADHWFCLLEECMGEGSMVEMVKLRPNRVTKQGMAETSSCCRKVTSLDSAAVASRWMIVIVFR